MSKAPTKMSLFMRIFPIDICIQATRGQTQGDRKIYDNPCKANPPKLKFQHVGVFFGAT